jgi:hypothetical protein
VVFQKTLREMVKVITAAAPLTGDLSKALFRLRNETIADDDRMTAAELVAEGQVEAVSSYLREFENGVSE